MDFNLLCYARLKQRFLDTKPIRGRDEDVRPIKGRRRTHERIEMTGDVVACRLHDTQVVRYYPDGRVAIRDGGWPTNSTAEFIHQYSPVYCKRVGGRLWLGFSPQRDGGYIYAPLPKQGLTFVPIPGTLSRFTLEGNPKFYKRATDRVEAKRLREPLQHFIQYGLMMLKLCDGILMPETRSELAHIKTGQFIQTYGVPGMVPWHHIRTMGDRDAADMYHAMVECPEELFPNMLFALFDCGPRYRADSGAHYGPVHVSPEEFKRRVYDLTIRGNPSATVAVETALQDRPYPDPVFPT